MRQPDKLPKHGSNDGYLHRVCIPCMYNSGRRATVRATIGHPEIIHIRIDTEPGRPYQSVEDGYLHLNTEFIDESLSIDPEEPIIGYRRKEAEEMVEMIKGINIHYFAGTLTVLSDDKAIVRRSYPRCRSLSQIWQDVKAAYVQHANTLDFDRLFSHLAKKQSWLRKTTSRVRYAMSELKTQREQIEQVVPLSSAHLGGTWQDYYGNQDWLEEAKALKGGMIYLA